VADGIVTRSPKAPAASEKRDSDIMEAGETPTWTDHAVINIQAITPADKIRAEAVTEAAVVEVVEVMEEE